MKAYHRDAFDAEVRLLGAEFGRKVSDGTLQQWWEALNDITWEQFEAGVGEVRRTCNTFPPPIAVRRLVVTERVKSKAEQAAEEEAARQDAEFRAWRADEEKVAADKARMARLRLHFASALGTTDRVCQNPPHTCEVCRHEKAHPAAHRHLKDGIVAADVDWAVPVEGCCG